MDNQHDFIYRLHPIDLETKPRKKKLWHEMSPQERWAAIEPTLIDDAETAFLRDFDKHWKRPEPVHENRYRLVGSDIVYQDRGYFFVRCPATPRHFDNVLLHGHTQVFPSL